jgi:hypothetical protein
VPRDQAQPLLTVGCTFRRGGGVGAIVLCPPDDQRVTVSEQQHLPAVSGGRQRAGLGPRSVGVQIGRIGGGALLAFDAATAGDEDISVLQKSRRSVMSRCSVRTVPPKRLRPPLPKRRRRTKGLRWRQFWQRSSAGAGHRLPLPRSSRHQIRKVATPPVPVFLPRITAAPDSKPQLTQQEHGVVFGARWPPLRAVTACLRSHGRVGALSMAC